MVATATALMIVAFLIAFSVPLGAYWLLRERFAPDGGEETEQTTSEGEAEEP